jgi:hypothetical protein
LSQRRGNEHWINPLLERLDLVREKEKDLARNACWKKIEECELVERIGKLVVEVNRVAGYRVLEMVDFLPPQKNVLRVSFERGPIKHNLEFAIRESGIALMFSTTNRSWTAWRPRFSTHSKRSNSTLAWDQIVHPEEISEENIQAWISYLLSGLDKKFRLDQILHDSPAPDADLSAALRKLSA